MSQARYQFRLVMFFVCLFCAVIASIIWTMQSRNLSREGVATTGTVVSIKRIEEGRSGGTARVKFSFEVEGKTYSNFDTLPRKRSNQLRVDYEVPVLYQKGNPSLAKLGEPGELWEVKGHFSPSFWLLAVIGLLLYLPQLKRRFE